MDYALAENDLKRLRRQLGRFYYGLEGYQASDYTFVTLTTPEDFDKKRLNAAWRLFTLRMKRAHSWGEYYACREWNVKGTCEHLHIVLKVQSLDYGLVRKHWTDCVSKYARKKRKTIWVKVLPCYSRDGSNKGLGQYLSKYLVKQVSEKNDGYYRRFGRAMWYSQGWIFPGWRTFSKIKWRIGEKINFVEYKILLKELGKVAFKRLLTVRLALKSLSIKRLGWSITLSKELRQHGLWIDFWRIDDGLRLLYIR